MRDALVGTAFAEAPLRLADAADDRALRAHASAAFAALKNARAENELSRRVMQHKLNFTRTMIEAIRTLHDESGVAGLPGASPFQPSSSLRAGPHPRLGLTPIPEHQPRCTALRDRSFGARAIAANANTALIRAEVQAWRTAPASRDVARYTQT